MSYLIGYLKSLIWVFLQLKKWESRRRYVPIQVWCSSYTLIACISTVHCTIVKFQNLLHASSQENAGSQETGIAPVREDISNEDRDISSTSDIMFQPSPGYAMQYTLQSSFSFCDMPSNIAEGTLHILLLWQFWLYPEFWLSGNFMLRSGMFQADLARG